MRSAPSSATQRNRDNNSNNNNNNNQIVFPPLIATLDTYISASSEIKLENNKLSDNSSITGRKSEFTKKKVKGKKKKNQLNKTNPLVSINNKEKYNLAREILEPQEYSPDRESARPDSRKYVEEIIKSPNPPSPRKQKFISDSSINAVTHSPVNDYNNDDFTYQYAEKPTYISHKQSPRSFARPLRIADQPQSNIPKSYIDEVSLF